MAQSGGKGKGIQSMAGLLRRTRRKGREEDGNTPRPVIHVSCYEGFLCEMGCLSSYVDATPKPCQELPVPNPVDGSTSNAPAGVRPMPWMIGVRKRVEAPPSIPNTEKQPTIFFVPENIRRIDPPAYTPQVVNIGPYHRKNALPKNEITTSLCYYKRQCARILMCPNGTQDYSLMYKCLAMITNKLIPDIRSCYSTGITRVADGKLAEMMLCDGCFIIRCLLKKHVDDGTHQGPLLGMPWIWNLVKYDMLKLENQIPFFVLKELFEFIKSHKINNVLDGKDLIDLALKFFRDIRPSKSKSFEAKGNVEYHHLLHLFYSSLLPCDANHVIQLDHRENPALHEWIPNATELGRAGVGFKEKKHADSFLDITFKNGVIEIPSQRIMDYSNTIFRNLIAFEQCFPKTKAQITAYAVFMDCLIDTARDVNLLDLQRTLVNRLSTDEAVADLFNSLTNQVHYALDRNYLHDLFVEVNRYHQSWWHKERASLIRNYFGSPWSVLSVIAAAILIIFTGLQTFYTVYSYYRPK